MTPLEQFLTYVLYVLFTSAGVSVLFFLAKMSIDVGWIKKKLIKYEDVIKDIAKREVDHRLNKSLADFTSRIEQLEATDQNILIEVTGLKDAFEAHIRGGDK